MANQKKTTRRNVSGSLPCHPNVIGPDCFTLVQLGTSEVFGTVLVPPSDQCTPCPTVNLDETLLWTKSRAVLRRLVRFLAGLARDET